MLDFIGKLIGASARVGGAVALAAVALYVLRRNEIEPFTKLDTTLYQATIVAGIIGICVVVVELLVVVWKGTLSSFHQRRGIAKAQRTNKTTALKNLRVLPAEYTSTLLFLKANNAQRFPGPATNQLLYSMRQACLLEIDDPNYGESAMTYYQVPDYVWNAIDHFPDILKSQPVPTTPPWI